MNLIDLSHFTIWIPHPPRHPVHLHARMLVHRERQWHERSSSAPAQDQDGRRIGEFEPASAPITGEEPQVWAIYNGIYHMYIYI